MPHSGAPCGRGGRGAGLMAALMVLDLARTSLVGTRGILALAPFTLGGRRRSPRHAALLAHRGTVRAEPLGLIAVLAVFGVALLGEALTPDGQMLGTAQLAIILVGVGLFLPWRQPWHLAALVAAIALAVAFVLSPLGDALRATTPET